MSRRSLNVLSLTKDPGPACFSGLGLPPTISDIVQTLVEFCYHLFYDCCSSFEILRSTKMNWLSGRRDHSLAVARSARRPSLKDIRHSSQAQHLPQRRSLLPEYCSFLPNSARRVVRERCRVGKAKKLLDYGLGMLVFFQRLLLCR